MVAPLLIDQRYRLVRRLRGNDDVTLFLVHDAQRDRLLALKVFLAPDELTLKSYQTQLRLLATLSHPHIAETIDSGTIEASTQFRFGSRDGTYLYQANEYLAGPNFRAAFTPDSLGNDPELRAFLMTANQICDALDYVHRRRLIHFDIKPENILLAEPPSPDHVLAKLIDFELSQKASTPLGPRIRGTLQLVSPEVIRDSVISEKADLYSFGATLYLVATGRSPFAASTERDLMAQILTEDPVPPHEINTRLPAPLSQLILDLLEKEPARRPGSAREVRGRITELLNDVAAPSTPRLSPPAVEPHRAEEPALVGRELPFRFVAGELDHLGQGETLHSILFLVGQSGTGKRRFLTELERYAALHGIDVFRTDCLLPRSQPYDALRDIVSQLRRRLPSDQSVRLRAREALDYLGGKPPEGYAAKDPTQAVEMRKIFFSQLADFFIRSLEGRKAIFVFEYLELADPAEVHFLGFLANLLAVRSRSFAGGKRGERPSANLVITATLRQLPPDAPGEPLQPIIAAPYADTVDLEHLSPEKTAELIRHSRGGSDLSHEVLALIHGVTGGHPLYLNDIQKFLSDATPDEFLSQIRRLPSGIAAYFRYLANEAPKEELRVAYALSFAGKALPLDVLARAMGTDTEEIARYADEERLLKRRNGGIALRWWHMAAEFPSLTREHSNTLAAAVAAELEKQGAITDAARLYARAGREEAIPLARTFGERAQRLLAWEGAARLCAEVRRTVSTKEPEFLTTLADLEETCGNHVEALALLSEVEVAPEDRAQLCIRLGRLKAKAGEPAEAFKLLEEANGAAKAAGQDEDRVRAITALAELHLQSQKHERAESLLRDALERSDPFPHLRARVRHLLGRASMGRKAWAEALVHFQKGAKEHEEAGDPYHLSESLLQAGTASIGRGDFGQAIGAFRHALALNQESLNPLGEALAQHKLGITHYRRGEIELALKHLGEAHAIWKELGDQSNLADSLNNLGLAHRSAGNLDEAVTHFQESLKILSALNDEEGQAAVLNNLASVLDAHGRYREALTQSFKALELRKRQRDRHSIAHSYFRIGDIYRQMGDLDHALSFARKSYGFSSEVSDKLGMAHTLQLLGSIHLLQGRYGKSLRRLRQGLIQFQALGNRLGKLPLLLNMARLYYEVGAFGGAGEFLDQSEEIARESDLPLYRAETHFLRALVKEAEGDLYGADTLLREADRLLRLEPNRKILAEILLYRAQVLLELGNLSRGEENLERAYSVLSEIGCRDLSPQYFFLRTRSLLLGRKPSLDTAERLLARALSEAQELSMMPLLAWVHLEFALLCRRKDSEQAGREHVARAEEILWQLQEDLPLRLQRTFNRSRLSQRARDESAEYSQAPETAPRADQRVDAEELAAIRQHNRNLERLQEITQALNRELVLDKVLVRIIDAALELANAERGFLIIGSGKERRFQVARNLLGEDVVDPSHEISQSIAQEVFRTGKALVTNDAIGDARLAKFKSVRDLKLMSIAGLPLKVRDRTIGVLYLDNRTVKNAFREDDLSLLRTLCNQAGIATENARLIEENRKKQRALEESNIRIAGLNRRLTDKLREKTVALKQARNLLGNRFRFGNIVGKSKQMQELFHIMGRVSKTDLPVLIEGESGTGKELIANAIHFNSARRAQPIISENCGAITSTLLESELFGHVRGAFTGAIKEKKGLFELAHRGTLFLDEVGDMDLDMQKKLLRVLEEGEIRRVGGKNVITVDVRLITATNHNLRELCTQGRFREDLFWRLNVIRISIPPLRERQEDIPLLAEYFLQKIAKAEGGERRRLSPGALRRLLAYHWPGNVRELQHFLERAHLLARGEVIHEEEVILEGETTDNAVNPPFHFSTSSLKEAKDEFTRWYLKRTLEEHGGVVSRAARGCGISRETFHRLIRKHGLADRE